MNNSNHEINSLHEDGISLFKILQPLLKRKLFIIGFTGLVTLSSILYLQTLPPIYKASTSFIAPSKNEISTLNQLPSLETLTKTEVFNKFLTVLSTKEFQKKILVENDFITQFNSNILPIDIDKFSSKITASIQINPTNAWAQTEKLILYNYEMPYILSMQSTKSKVLSEFLNKLVESASDQVRNDLIKISESEKETEASFITSQIDKLRAIEKQGRLNKIKYIKEEDSNKLRKINAQIESARYAAKENRLNQIERIKDEDSKKISQIKGQIDRVRYQAKENRLNQIVVLLESAKLAKSLGIIENNFKLNNDDGAKSDVTIAIVESKDLPEWYLYGEKALMQRVELLENRMNDDPFIPEIVTLNNQLNEVQNNSLLKTLEMRQNDDPFTPKIVTLNNELTVIEANSDLKQLENRKNDDAYIPQLASLIFDLNRINKKNNLTHDKFKAFRINQIAIAPQSPIKPDKKLIALLVFFVSFMMSSVLVLIMGLLKPDEKTPA